MAYHSFNKQIITDFGEENVASMYESGYVFTRESRGSMNQTRSLRIDLEKFELSSENKRILGKVEGIEISAEPLPMQDYSWEIGKLAKDFYDRFGDKTFTANKVKELLTTDKSNFNLFLNYSLSITPYPLGRAICYGGKSFLHYAYPFYDTTTSQVVNMGMGMMLMAIMLAKEPFDEAQGKQGDKYFYLGSATRPGDSYKLQFKGLEYWDGKEWSKDLEQLKAELNG